MKIKKIFLLVFILLLLSISGYCLLQLNQKIEQRKDVYKSIPAFCLRDINGNMIMEETLEKNKPTLFLFFNPDCDLCRDEIMQIQSHQDAFSSFQTIFFSPVSADKIVAFLDEISFRPSSNMRILIDENEDLTNKMEAQTSPTSYIYNRKNQLVKRFNGPVKIETLIKYLSEL